MGFRFVAALLISFALTVAILGAAGFAFSMYWTPAPRDPFRTGFFEFDLAPGWSCERAGTEHVCVPPGKPPYAATAIITTKFRGAQDNLDAYEAHLRTPQKSAIPGKDAAARSEISYVKRRTLGSREWVEGLHLGSEVPGYYTYYLATITAQLGILVTMSVQKDREKAYGEALSDMMKTLHTYQR